MSWFSILPAHLTVVETWIIRFFVRSPVSIMDRKLTYILQLLLGIITIGPWLLLIVYDLVLYVFRAIAYEVPYFGGRARGRQKPRAPSFAERPSGSPLEATSFNSSSTLRHGDRGLNLSMAKIRRDWFLTRPNCTKLALQVRGAMTVQAT